MHSATDLVADQDSTAPTLFPGGDEQVGAGPDLDHVQLPCRPPGAQSHFGRAVLPEEVRRRVSMLGVVQYADLPRYHAAADVFQLLSLLATATVGLIVALRRPWP